MTEEQKKKRTEYLKNWYTKNKWRWDLYRAKNREKRRENNKKYAESHREQIVARRRSYYIENREKVLARNRECELKREYGLTLNEYNSIKSNQDGKCAICGKVLDKSAHVDHNHTTGEVRGLLCSSCNRGIGYLKDSPEILRNAAIYLESHLT